MKENNELVKTMRMNYLFDFYQGLLTEKQRNYLELYYLQDYALSEIAETFHVSRQAVYDNIKRTDELLEEYESKLQLFEKFKERQSIIEELKRLSVDNQEINQAIERLEILE
ncbi:putative DNA-binding protein [Mammaliicoccus sp. Dog046]|uniref:putative DNA-binding protein n=1 Tax=Mammaliicoccus sp. Dog046 TaxID=3034233 RepID=UPI002B2641DA|nr:putative DNA-binding protein [Mammaliicoccus sp. Dog046]WQK84574.1 putative DNA-binding protein [Mammaliicoccus sp. Dog046]